MVSLVSKLVGRDETSMNACLRRASDRNLLHCPSFAFPMLSLLMSFVLIHSYFLHSRIVGNESSPLSTDFIKSSCPPHPDHGPGDDFSPQRWYAEPLIHSNNLALAALAMLGISWRTVAGRIGHMEVLLAPIFNDSAASSIPFGHRLSFTALVHSEMFLPFLRSVLLQIEGELGLADYHLRIVPDPRRLGPKWSRLTISSEDNSTFSKYARRAGFVVLVVGSLHLLCNKFVPTSASLNGDDLDTFIAYTDGSGKEVHPRQIRAKDLLVKETPLTRCSLDAQGRAMYVVTVRRFVRRQTELSDNELHEMWLCGLDAIAELHGSRTIDENSEDMFFDMRLNAGLYQNMAHVHLKIWMDSRIFLQRWGDNQIFKALTER